MFIVYSSDVDECPPMNVAYSKQKNSAVVFTIYTPASVFKYKYGHSDASVEVNPLWMIPYRGGPCCGLSGYLCIFEPVVPLVDALNALQSNRLDDVAQYINSFLAILGAQVDEEAYKKLDEWKMPCLPEGTDAKYLSSPMSQADVQTLKDDLYQAILTICGVPNRNGGMSTSETGQAVELRDGWSSAETRAKDIKTSFKDSEWEHLTSTPRLSIVFNFPVPVDGEEVKELLLETETTVDAWVWLVCRRCWRSRLACLRADALCA